MQIGLPSTEKSRTGGGTKKLGGSRGIKHMLNKDKRRDADVDTGALKGILSVSAKGKY